MIAYDVIIIGAGAAGMMCAIEAGKRYQRVLLLEKSNKPGRKILMSGGGRCNFTNLHIRPECYISQNPHFAKSALSRYTQWDFIDRVKRHGISFHEKTLGQLFCDYKAHAIVEMLLKEMKHCSVQLTLNADIMQLRKINEFFEVEVNATENETQKKIYSAKKLVIATGGLSIPSMGSNPFAYHIAEQFDLNIIHTRAGLVPLTWHQDDKERYSVLAGISNNNVSVSTKKKSFKEDLLFTHRGLSGPAILQISSYWKPGEIIHINFLPEIDLLAFLKNKQRQEPKILLKTVLSFWFAQRFLSTFFNEALLMQRLADISHKAFEEIIQTLQHWQFKPNGTEGYRTAEVTLGGIDTNELSSKTMEAKKIPGLFFIGEAVDVTGWLGGYNFQWAWSSGWVAGQSC